MATRGVFQLVNLKLFYCEHGGSSRAARDFIGGKHGGRLVNWATTHPHVQVEVQLRNGKHPYLLAEYLNGNTHQVCIKNYETTRQIESVCNELHNRSGRKITKITKPVLTDTPSIQGVWTPFLDLSDESKFKVKIVE